MRLLKDDGPMTERPNKRQRLESVSEENPVPAPEALPAPTWTGWADLADEMGLNAAHGPSLVHGMARLYAQQRRHLALPRKQRTQNPPPVHEELQRLSVMLHLAEASRNTFWLCVRPEAFGCTLRFGGAVLPHETDTEACHCSMLQADATQSSGQAAAEQLQQPQRRHKVAPPSGGPASRQPLQQTWPEGLPTASQLLESQADELVR